MSRFRDAAEHRDARLSQDVLDNRFTQPRSVVIELQAVGCLIEAEFLQPVGIGELAERAELLRLEPALKLVRHGHECHAESIASAGGEA